MDVKPYSINQSLTHSLTHSLTFSSSAFWSNQVSRIRYIGIVSIFLSTLSCWCVTSHLQVSDLTAQIGLIALLSYHSCQISAIKSYYQCLSIYVHPSYRTQRTIHGHLLLSMSTPGNIPRDIFNNTSISQICSHSEMHHTIVKSCQGSYLRCRDRIGPRGTVQRSWRAQITGSTWLYSVLGLNKYVIYCNTYISEEINNAHIQFTFLSAE